MKKVFFVALFAVASLAATAQKKSDKKVNFALGASFAIPTGDLNISHKAAPGIEAQASTSLAANLEGFAQVGVGFYSGKDFGGGVKASNLTHVPILVGARYNGNNFLAGAGIGYGLWSGGGSNSNGFMYSPQAGYDFGKIQALANYSATSVSGGTLSTFGVKVFYKF